jgi:hypothetical protein
MARGTICCSQLHSDKKYEWIELNILTKSALCLAQARFLAFILPNGQSMLPLLEPDAYYM